MYTNICVKAKEKYIYILTFRSPFDHCGLQGWRALDAIRFEILPHGLGGPFAGTIGCKMEVTATNLINLKKEKVQNV